MIEVKFCRLDARDDSYTGYAVAAFTIDDQCIRNDMPSKELGRLSILLEREYLVRVRALQDELAAKYEKLAKAISTTTPPVAVPWGNGLSKSDYEKVERAAKAQFPGKIAEYYT